MGHAACLEKNAFWNSNTLQKDVNRSGRWKTRIAGQKAFLAATIQRKTLSCVHDTGMCVNAR